MSQAEQSEPTKRPRVMTTHLTPLVIFAAIAVALMLGYEFLKRFRAPRLNPLLQPAVGKHLEHLRLLPLTSGEKPLSLDDLKGRVVLVNVWGTWCAPCRDELPRMAELRKRYAGQEKFLLLALSTPSGGWGGDVESLREETASLLEQLGIDLPTYFDPDSAAESYKLGGRIDIQDYPTTLLFDRDGVIRAEWIGYRRGAETEMERYIGVLLDKLKKPE
ncbi:MAG: TlpA family protein disulfide reductase [Pirellulales bacterium]|nr:TlpA family protein disulfide reductase [Pirellulales bacterium]